jgi:hypothetical protein
MHTQAIQKVACPSCAVDVSADSFKHMHAQVALQLCKAWPDVQVLR